MARIFRFSGYFVDGDKQTFDLESFKDHLTAQIDEISGNYQWQQLHIEKSNSFDPDGELGENCDLALLTRHFEDKNDNLEYDRPLPKKGQQYKHFKLGKIVTVIGISKHTETQEITVVYEYAGKIWNRPLEMFMSEVDKEKYKEAKQHYRFERQN